MRQPYTTNGTSATNGGTPKNSHAEAIRRAQEAIVKRRPLLDAVHRQRWHVMPEVSWMNDPNGLIYFQGKYHFFYQCNPYDASWGSMHWGHVVSEDLIHWEYMPIALAPSEPYDDHPQGGCFSGSAIEHEGRLYILYTGATNYGDGFSQTQCLATSEDGIHFEKYTHNPIVHAPEGYDAANFRDPKIWKHGDNFYMVVGAKKNERAQALLYRSRDLLEWEFFNVLAESRGALGYMWECPDFFFLQGKHVLIFSPMGVGERKVMYLVGDMDYDVGKFNYTSIGEIDWGFDYYAPQTFVDKQGRRLIVAWANAWAPLSEEEGRGPTYKEGWCGAFSMLREVLLDKSDNRLRFVPIREYECLRNGVQEAQDLSIAQARYAMADAVSFEVKMQVNLKRTTAQTIKIVLRASARRQTLVVLDLRKGEMSIDRNNSDGWSSGISRSSLILQSETLLIHFFVDQSSIEFFTDNYKTVHSCNIYALEQDQSNWLEVDNGCLYLDTLQVYTLAAST